MRSDGGGRYKATVKGGLNGRFETDEVRLCTVERDLNGLDRHVKEMKKN